VSVCVPIGAEPRSDRRWTVSFAAPFVLACAPQVTTVGEWSEPPALYLEAEDGELSGGFVATPDDLASNGAFLGSPDASLADEAPGEARALYTFSLPADGLYTIWGRIRSPGAENNRFWVSVDDEPWFKWRISVGDVWFWDDLHDDTAYGTPATFQLARGTHVLSLGFCVSGAELDRLYVTALGDVPPGNDTSCDPPHSIELGGACYPSCGSQSGTLCGATACSGRTIFEAYDCGVCCR
jgi:hypothetical protein